MELTDTFAHCCLCVSSWERRCREVFLSNRQAIKGHKMRVSDLSWHRVLFGRQLRQYRPSLSALQERQLVPRDPFATRNKNHRNRCCVQQIINVPWFKVFASEAVLWCIAASEAALQCTAHVMRIRKTIFQTTGPITRRHVIPRNGWHPSTLMNRFH